MKGTFAETLAHLRAKRGLTQRQLGSSAGVAWSMISKYESGQSSPRLKILMRLAKALDVSVDELQGHEPEPDSVPIILESPDGDEMPISLDRKTFDQMQEAARESGKPVGEILSETIAWGLRMIKESPEFAASLKRQIKDSREPDDGE
ncbi:helix-turn-helix domain-containing protein [Pseudomonas sp. zjy_15]|uniref:helix-turn-helix domain-containing protein n=1 Tax=Pseudomonas sp. zjy_15 TaxID=3367265 RepID=UPI00370B3FDB